MMRTTHAAILLMGALLGTSLIATAQPDAGEVQSGRYRLAATPSEIATRMRAIDGAAQQFFIVVRPIARSTLESKTRVAAWLDFHREDDKITVEFEGRPAITGSLAAPSQWRSPEDETFTVEFKLGDGEISQTLRGDSGTRINRFRPNADGRLALHVEITSAKLSTPLRYTLTYRLQETKHP